MMIAGTSPPYFTGVPACPSRTKMNGLLSEQPLAELIREISLKNLSGRLRLQHEQIKVVAYFKKGVFTYAASNARGLRLREYLLQGKLVSEQQLGYFGQNTSDLELSAGLLKENLVTAAQAEQIQAKQVADVLRLALLWPEGTWEFDYRPSLKEEVSVKVDIATLLLEAGRRLPLNFTASRFKDSNEVIAPVESPCDRKNLLPKEVFLLSRLDRPTALTELVAMSGLRELDALRSTYSLALAGLLAREHWKNAFRTSASKSQKQKEKPAQQAEPQAPEKQAHFVAVEPRDVDGFLTALSNAKSHYEVLGVANNAQPAEIKNAYYEIARRYHPDRFRKDGDAALQARLDSAFARVTQAYDTLRNARQRETYDSRLASRARAEALADSAPKASSPSPEPSPDVASSASEKTEEVKMSAAERAELHFKEGFAALQLGKINVALGLFASAARSVPNEPRYRAYHGHVLSKSDSTRRLAEGELQAAIKLEPNNPDYRVMLAELFRDLGFRLRARAEAERALAAAPNHQKARELLESLK
jgi:curved DNA-binding protein CbpA